jgi:hypothetical protein
VALKLKGKESAVKTKARKMYGMNEDDPVDAPVGYAPRVVKVPMHDNADVNPAVHEAKEKQKNSNTKPSMEKSVNSPRVMLLRKGGPGSGPKPGQNRVLQSHEYPDHIKTKFGREVNIAHAEQHDHGLYHVENQGANVHMAYFTPKRKGSKAQSVGMATNVDGAKQRIADHVEQTKKPNAQRETGHSGPVPISDIGKLKKSNERDTMSGKNQVADLFKSNSGDGTITHCVHCKHGLTTEDLKKGLGASFVADDNNGGNLSSGGSGQVEPSRPGAGVSENDVIAPLLKGMKGSEAGDGEEYPINKSEMSTMGMKTDGLDEGWYTITKAEMKRIGAEQHIAFLADRKSRVAKSATPNVNLQKSIANQSNQTQPNARPIAPPGYSPRAGGVHGPRGPNDALVIWEKGDDEAIAKAIEQQGNYGQGSDESIRTRGPGSDGGGGGFF